MKTYLIKNTAKHAVNAYGLELAPGQSKEVDFKTYMSACRLACVQKVGQVDNKETEVSSDDEYVCQKCGKVYKTESALKRHAEKCGDK